MFVWKNVKNEIKTFWSSRAGHYLLWGMATLYAGGGVCYLLNMADFAGQVDRLGFTQSALALLCFVIVGYFLKKVYHQWKAMEDVKERKRCFRFAFVFGSLLALSFIWGYELRIVGNTLPGYKNKVFELLMAVGCGLALLPLTCKWFLLLTRVKRCKKRDELSRKTKRKLFWFSWLAVFLCWIPVFLAYYPAIMSYDFHRQSQEALLGYIWFNDHHPLVHTFLIRVFLLLGQWLGSVEAGMAIFSLLQMLILSAVLAYSCNVAGRMLRRVWPVAVLAVVYGVLPIHPVLAMSMTKDILFSAFFLLLVLLIWERKHFVDQWENVRGRKRLKRLGFGMAILLTGILAILLRNNAVYAFAIFAVFYVLYSSKERLRIAILCVAVIAGGLCCKTAIREAMDAGTGNKMEMFSVFMQQFARVGQKQSDILTQEERLTIDYYVPEYLWESYNPPLSDTIKGDISAYYSDNWLDDLPEMFSEWAKIGLRYPNEYIDAFLALTSGFWFLDDVSHAEVLGYGADTNLGLLYTFNASVSNVFEGVESRSYFPALLSAYQKIVNGNSYYGWPVLSLLFKPAFYCWLLVLAFVSYWYLKKPKKQLLTLFPLLYLLTMLLGPVVNMRYVYPVTIVVPVLLAYIFCQEDKKGELDVKAKEPS